MDVLTISKYGAVISAAVIVVVVLLQARSGGLGAVLGGSGGGGVYRAKRGMEAVMYNLTVVFGILFAVFSLAVAILSV